MCIIQGTLYRKTKIFGFVFIIILALEQAFWNIYLIKGSTRFAVLIEPPLHANQEEEALQGYIIEKILYQQQTKQLPVMHVSLCVVLHWKNK